MGHLERKLRPRPARPTRRCDMPLLLLAATLASSPLGAQQPTPPLRFAAFTFDGGSATTEADSASLTVPVRRASTATRAGAARTSSSMVSLPLVRFRATDASRRDAPPIIYLSGGTGSGIAAARGARFPFFQALRALGDVVTFDLRGAGRSTPRIACASDAPLPVDVPFDYARIVALLRENARVCADSLRRAGIDLAGFNLRETVEDIDAIRRALGVDKVSLVGISTGSEIGLEYVRRHGDHVAHAVLAGVQGPHQTVDLPSDQEAVLRELSARLDTASPAGAAKPALLGTIRAVIDTLRARPVSVRIRPRQGGDSVTVALGALDAQLLASATLGDRQRMQLLPALFGAAAGGNFRPLAAFKLEASRGGITSAFEALGDCQTGVAPERLAARAREARSALLGWGTLDFPEHCAGWGVPLLDASWRSPVRSDASVLLISGTLDGRTSVASARDVLTGLANGSHLIVRGASHGDDLFLSTPEIGTVIAAFLRGDARREMVVDASR